MLTEIISGIWIGDMNDIYNEQFYKDNLINIVINCTRDQDFLDLPDLQKLRIPLSLNMDPNNDIYMLNTNKRKIMDFIHSNIESNHNILICCCISMAWWRVHTVICEILAVRLHLASLPMSLLYESFTT